MKANDLKPGMAILQSGQLWVIRNTEHVKPGKGPAYIQVKIKAVASGAVQEKRFRATEEVDQVNLDRRDMEYLYSDSTGHVFMDQESFEQIVVPSELLEDQMAYLKPNTVISVLMYEGNPVSAELPTTVDLEITDTAPQVKGATATNQLKEATCETGLKTRVPPFIENGEVVRINTADGSYVSRV